VSRLKNGMPSTHPLRGPELRALRRLHREFDESAHVFATERRGPLTESTARKIVARAAGAWLEIRAKDDREARGPTRSRG
jgi:hypothetical protein